ncbi:MAG: bifunctional phosphopantothenoylcysteine decarboxylase/phosphopantothenate--cysteine ligase CoaBC [Nannocystaceae bacterium]
MSRRPDRVLLVVAGGIAAYKAPELVRALKAEGCDVQVIATPAALAFVTELALSTVSGRPVRTTLLDAAAEGSVGHIELADWPDTVLVAPATADLMARAAAGLASDLATCVLLATRAPIVWAPAMNTNMWRHPATQKNLATLAGYGGEFVGPDRGELACGWVGEGRMIDPPILAAAARSRAARARGGPWVGRRVLVSAGPTRSHIDPVRFIANASTGAMGFAIAEEAAKQGASVTLVAGPVDRATPPAVQRVDVTSAGDMLEAMEAELERAPVDLVAMVAAVGDLEIERPHTGKLEKQALIPSMAALGWRRAVDVLATLTGRKRGATKFLGFAAQTVEGVDEAAITAELVRLGLHKLAYKGADALFVNRVGVPGLGFASDTNAGILLVRRGQQHVERPSGPPTPKRALARWLLDQLGAEFFEEGAR